MNINRALKAFSALSQETRLKVFKILVEYGGRGTPAGNISERLSIPHNTLSFHLSHLSQAGLVKFAKRGRSIIYSANCEMIEDLICYLNENCCINEIGKPSICADSNSKKRERK